MLKLNTTRPICSKTQDDQPYFFGGVHWYQGWEMSNVAGILNQHHLYQWFSDVHLWDSSPPILTIYIIIYYVYIYMNIYTYIIYVSPHSPYHQCWINPQQPYFWDLGTHWYLGCSSTYNVDIYIYICTMIGASYRNLWMLSPMF